MVENRDELGRTDDPDAFELADDTQVRIAGGEVVGSNHHRDANQEIIASVP